MSETYKTTRKSDGIPFEILAVYAPGGRMSHYLKVKNLETGRTTNGKLERFYIPDDFKIWKLEQIDNLPFRQAKGGKMPKLQATVDPGVDAKVRAFADKHFEGNLSNAVNRLLALGLQTVGGK
jgi:hypothetical protein